MSKSHHTELDMDADRKLQALLMVYQGHAELLRFMSKHDLQVFGGYITLQLALGGWLSQPRELTTTDRIAIAIIDASLALIAGVLIHLAYKRRREIHDLFANLNAALLFTQKGAYLPEVALWPQTKFRPWRLWYIFGIALAFAGIVILLTAHERTGQRSITSPRREGTRLTSNLRLERSGGEVTDFIRLSAVAGRSTARR